MPQHSSYTIPRHGTPHVQRCIIVLNAPIAHLPGPATPFTTAHLHFGPCISCYSTAIWYTMTSSLLVDCLCASPRLFLFTYTYMHASSRTHTHARTGGAPPSAGAAAGGGLVSHKGSRPRGRALCCGATRAERQGCWSAATQGKWCSMTRITVE
eukprot:1149529-Pelagomonas_calceolata.AAC.5